jgi:hypothetical protein
LKGVNRISSKKQRGGGAPTLMLHRASVIIGPTLRWPSACYCNLPIQGDDLTDDGDQEQHHVVLVPAACHERACVAMQAPLLVDWRQIKGRRIRLDKSSSMNRWVGVEARVDESMGRQRPNRVWIGDESIGSRVCMCTLLISGVVF